MVMVTFKARMKTCELNPVLFSLKPQYGLEAVDRNSRSYIYPFGKEWGRRQTKPCL